jgi:hypothetical protein
VKDFEAYFGLFKLAVDQNRLLDFQTLPGRVSSEELDSWFKTPALRCTEHRPPLESSSIVVLVFTESKLITLSA